MKGHLERKNGKCGTLIFFNSFLRSVGLIMYGRVRTMGMLARKRRKTNLCNTENETGH